MLLDPLNLVGAGWVNDAAKAARTPRLFHGSPVAGIKQFDPSKLKDVGLHAGALDAAISRLPKGGARGSVYGVKWPMKKILNTEDPGHWYGPRASKTLRDAGAKDLDFAIQEHLENLKKAFYRNESLLDDLMRDDLELAKAHGIDTNKWHWKKGDAPQGFHAGTFEESLLDDVLNAIDDVDAPKGFRANDDALFPNSYPDDPLDEMPNVPDGLDAVSQPHWLGDDDLAQQFRQSPYYLEMLDELASIHPSMRVYEDAEAAIKQARMRHMTDTLQGLGYDTIRYPNKYESPLQGLNTYSYAALDPTSVRIMDEVPLGGVSAASPLPEIRKIAADIEQAMDEMGLPPGSVEYVRDHLGSRDVTGAVDVLNQEIQKVVAEARETAYRKGLMPGAAQAMEDRGHEIVSNLHKYMKEIAEKGSEDIFDPLAAPMPKMSDALLKSLALHGGARASAMNR
jgi:hypothetical protein